MAKKYITIMIILFSLLSLNSISLASSGWNEEDFGWEVEITRESSWNEKGFGWEVEIITSESGWHSASFGWEVDIYGWGNWSDWWNITQNQVSAPSSFTANNYNNSMIDLSWTNNIYADTTHIRGKKGSSPSSVTDGFLVYNSTGESYQNTGLDLGTHYYYKAWSWNDTIGFSSDTITADDWTSPGNPSTLQSPEQGINYINLTWNKGTNTTNTAIRYQTSSYPSNPQSGSEGYNNTESLCQVGSLAEATPFYFRVWSYANGYFSDSYVQLIQSTTGDLQPPSSFTASNFDNSRIDLSWTNNIYADTTHIRGKKGSSPSSVTDGFLVYNSTGESYQNTGLDLGTHYYYKAWSFNTSEGFSASSVTDDDWTSPGNPTNLQNTGITSNSINISWTKGVNTTNTVVRYNDTSYPSNPQSGAEGYNNTGVYVNITPLSASTPHYIRLWSYANGYFSDSYVSTLIETHGTNPPPSSFTASNFDNSRIDLSWTKGAEADATSIVRKKGSSPANHDDGTEVYNSTGESYQNTGLDLGTHYYYKAWSWNDTSKWSSPVSDDTWTSPGNPTNFINGTVSYTSVILNWNNGTNSSNAVVRYQTGSYPSNPQSGSEGYNGSLNTTTIESLITNTTYFFRIWNYVNPFSDNYMSLTVTTLSTDTPAPPFNASVKFFTGGSLNITWERGERSDEDVVVRKTSGYPITWDDGTVMDRTNNSTGSPPLYFFNQTVSQSYYYCLFSYNITNISYSVPCQVPQYGGLGLNCFNESNPSQAIYFDILISNDNATSTFYAEDISNTYWLDIDDIPYGDDTIFVVSNSSYEQRQYYYDINIGNYYNLTFYLPPNEVIDPGGDGGGDGDGGTLRTYTNVISVTNPSVNATIPLTHNLEDIIEVTIYNVLFDERVKTDTKTVTNPDVNLTIDLTYEMDDVITVETYDVVYESRFKTDSISVSNPSVNATITFTETWDEIIGVFIWNSSIYGGWITVPNDKYSVNETECEIDDSVLDANTTVAKVEYYYLAVDYGQWNDVPNDKYFVNETECEIDDSAMDDNTTMARIQYYYLEAGVGQWMVIPTNKYSATTTQVEIDSSVLSANTTMAKAEYYYMHYDNATIETKLYILKVVNDFDVAVPDAKVTISRYISTTDSFEPVTILRTDANGQAECYLMPYNLYKVFIEADDYYDLEISEWIPDAEFYGIYHPKTFRVNYEQGSGDIQGMLFDGIVWDIDPDIYYHNNTFTMWFNISSMDYKIEWYTASLYYYNNSNMTWVLLNTTNITTAPGGGSISFVAPNVTGRYSFTCSFKKENYSVYTFGMTDGCRTYWVYHSYIVQAVSTIPDVAYLIIAIIFALLIMGFLVKFGAGANAGFAGLCVLGGMFALRPDLAFGDPSISIWFIFLGTTIAYIVVMFLSSRS